MIEIKNKKDPISGYTGCVPSKEVTEQDYIQQKNLDSHIPGYVGYIPSVKAQNLFAQTYGKVTENCHKHNYATGIEHPPQVKYKSTTKDTYLHPNNIKSQEIHEGKINGVKLSTFSNAAKYFCFDLG